MDRNLSATSGNALQTAEAAVWGVSATRGAIILGEILEEDYRRYHDTGFIPRHMVGIGIPKQPASHRWPAQGNDPSTNIGYDPTSPLEEGIRVRLDMGVGETPALSMPLTDAAINALGLPEVVEMVAKMLARYGGMFWDHAGNVSVRSQAGITSYYQGIAGVQLFNSFPYDNLKVLNTGSDTTHNPGGSPPPPPTNVTIFDTTRSNPTRDDVVFNGPPSTTVFQHRDLVAGSGTTEGINVDLDVVIGGTTYHGGYGICRKATAPAPAGGKRPIVFAFGSGLYRLTEDTVTYPSDAAPLATTWTNDATPRSRPDSVAGEILAGAIGKVNPTKCPNHYFNLAKNAGWYVIIPAWPRYPKQSVSDPGNGPFRHPHDVWAQTYLRAIIADLIANHSADSKRIYCVGRSEGGFLPQMMWSYMDDVMAGCVMITQNMEGPAAKGPLDTPPGTSFDVAIHPPATPVSVLFAQVNDPPHPIAQGGSPTPEQVNGHTYAVHLTPTHTTLNSTDKQEIASKNDAQLIYSSRHSAEGIAYCNGVAANLVGNGPQAVSAIGDPDGDYTTTTGRLYEWQTSPTPDQPGTTFFYEVDGPHLAGDNISNDGHVFDFLNTHQRP